MISFIYADKNMARTTTATFAHFVEVCGMLTIHDRKKRREGLDVTDALCKALGWYFPLLAKFRVRSVEELIFRKFPNVCPYCRSAPHDEASCKLVKGTGSTVDHKAVASAFKANWDKRPTGLDEWQQMFQTIYPRNVEDRGRSTIGLLEELGELAEAVRVFEVHPKYFLGEAADTFSYIMGIANEHAMRVAQEGGEFSLEKEFLARFPGLCVQCGSKVCACPGVPAATVGRMAKELDISDLEKPFVEDLQSFSNEGQQVAVRVFEATGGLSALSNKLPFDRGDANRALSVLCLQISEAVEAENADIAETLKTAALKISTAIQQPGSPKRPIEIDGLLTAIETAWKKLDLEHRTKIKSTDGIVGELGEMLDKFKVLFVLCSPINETPLRVNSELRVIKECIGRANSLRKVEVYSLPAATATDFHREMLEGRFDIIHFAGHSDGTSLVFEDENGNSADVPLTAIAEIIDRHPQAKGVILNACETGRNLTQAMSPHTIAMDDSIDDDDALRFSRGFYDAICRSMSVADAYQEGLTAVRLSGRSADHIKIISAQ